MTAMTYLDWARIGRKHSEFGPLGAGEGSGKLGMCFETLRVRLGDWLGVAPEHIVLTANGTEACDISLRCQARPDWEFVATTDQSHPLVEGTVRRLRYHLGRLLCREIEGVRIPWQSLQLRESVKEEGLGGGLGETFRGRAGCLVLEHLSYRGIRFDVEAVAGALSATYPEVSLVVDGTQASGVWRPGRPIFGYFGCLHKYIDSDAVGGFASVDPSWRGDLPQHVAARSYGKEGFSPFGTESLREVISNQVAVEEFFEEGWAHGRLRGHIEEFTRITEGLFVDWTGKGKCNKGSHIFLFRCQDSGEARKVSQELAFHGIRVGVLEDCIRVSLHYSLAVEEIRRAAQLVKDVLLRRARV